MPAGETPDDARLKPLKDLDGYFPFQPPKSLTEWEQRAKELRRQLHVSQGLWPMPTKTPAKAVVHGLVDRGDYTVEKVYLESFPGHYVTGNLYRPKGKTGRLPAVLCPHGHWSNGRFHDHGEGEVRRQIVQGAERFERSGRHPLQARCVQLARMGCVVFHYDMLGYADSTQLSFELAHRFAEQRPEFSSPDAWGFYSPQAELHMQSIMGVQTYNSIRALDWLSQRDDVDPDRIGVTGASGGGTQSFILCALDDRPAVAFPAVMVSTAMQGGCTCENASLLRVGTGNIEIAALIAPRPLGMTGADDWTVEIATKGLPELKSLYGLYDAQNRVMAAPLIHFGHNYNYVSRAVMYAFMNEHLALGHREPIVEEDFEPLSQEEMSVWNDDHPRPEGGAPHERSLIRWMTEDARQQLDAVQPKADDPASLERYREVVGGAFDAILGRSLPDPSKLTREKITKQDKGEYWLFADLIRYPEHGETLPVVFLHPKQWNGEVTVWIDGRGKAALFDAEGDPKPHIRKLLDSGVSVASTDLLFQGEFNADGKPPTVAPTVSNPREFAGYTLGYNRSLFAQRVHDILTLLAYIHGDEQQAEKIHLVGVAGAGPWAAAAAAQSQSAIESLAIDTQGFRFAALTSYRDANFLPGAVRYDDLPALLALARAPRLGLAGESQVPPIVRAARKAAGLADAELHGTVTDDEGALPSLVDWLVK
ncbi:MAG: alpha/beta hydrolase family protein [Pirellulales bacterium]